VFFFTFICSTTTLKGDENPNNGSEAGIEDESDGETLDRIEIEDLLALHEGRNGQCIGCVGVLGNLKKQFSELVLFETFIIPILNDKRASLANIQKTGERFNRRLINAIHRYNPSLNTNALRASIRKLINKTAEGLITGTLRTYQVRQQLKHHFNRITQFWKKFIFPNFEIQQVNANFRKTMTLVARLNSFNQLNGQFHRDFAAYQALITSTLNIINGIARA